MKEQMKALLKEAMKARDSVRMDTLRGLLSAIQYEEIQAGVNDLDPNGILTVLKREIKKKHEEIEFAKQANRAETMERAEKDLKVLEAFLPKQMSREELEGHAKTFIAANAGANMGVVMKHLKENFDGQYDGKMASELIKSLV